jgi:hypothetical protein
VSNSIYQLQGIWYCSRGKNFFICDVTLEEKKKTTGNQNAQGGCSPAWKPAAICQQDLENVLLSRRNKQQQARNRDAPLSVLAPFPWTISMGVTLSPFFLNVDSVLITHTVRIPVKERKNKKINHSKNSKGTFSPHCFSNQHRVKLPISDVPHSLNNANSASYFSPNAKSTKTQHETDRNFRNTRTLLPWPFLCTKKKKLS